MIRGFEREIPLITKDIEISIHNRFDIEVVDTMTGAIKQVVQAENVVLDRMWSYYLGAGSQSAIIDTYINIGTGSGSPSPSDVGLFTYLRSYETNTRTSELNDLKNVISFSSKAIMLPEHNVGSVITEVGIGYGNSNAYTLTHAMLKDMNGNPISIVKTDTDQITITSTFYIHFEGPSYEVSGLGLFPEFYELFRRRPVTLSSYMYLGSNVAGSALSVTLVKDIATKTFTQPYARVGVSNGNSGMVGYIASDTMSLDPNKLFPGPRIRGESLGTSDGSTLGYDTFYGGQTNVQIYEDGILSTRPFTSSLKYGPFNPLTNWLTPHTLSTDHVPGYPISHNGSTTIPMFESREFYNQYYQYGLTRFYIGSDSYAVVVRSVQISLDRDTWVKISSGGSDVYVDIPLEYQEYPWIRIVMGTPGNNARSRPLSKFTMRDSLPTNRIIFDTPPPAGTIITVDYDTPMLQKDENHVFDLEIKVTLGNYTGS